MLTILRNVRHCWQDVRQIGFLALPLIMSQLAQVALTTVDIIMLGMLSSVEIAAGGLALAVFNLFRAFFAGLVMGTGNLVAEADGRQDHALISQFAGAGLVLATLGALVSAIVLSVAEKPLIWLGQDPAIAYKAGRFLCVLAPAMFPCLWFQALRQFTIGLRQPGPLLWITVGCTALNGVLDYLLMFGRWGFPKLGLIGIAWATASVYLLSFLLFLGIVVRHKTLARHLSLAIWRTEPWVLVRTGRMGLMVAATFGSETAFFAVITMVIGSMGAQSLAAQVIANQFVYIVFMISSGISQAVSICISQVFAQGQLGHVRRLAYTGLGLGLAVMSVVAIPYLALPGALVRPFLGGSGQLDATVASLAAKLLTIAAFMQFFDCGQNIGVGVLRGIGEVDRSFSMTLIGYWLLGLPAVYCLGSLMALGIYGVWLGLSIGLGSTAFLLWRTFEQRLANPVH